ncbi:mitochondrial 2-enoyl thioester reductase [Ceratobasidium sp. 370]|nr:mitochondrial 2-enoyl thioester reductase [Ceratobasidium sp. 370]
MPTLTRLRNRLFSPASFHRLFSSRRAVVYSDTGDPAQVLSVSKISALSEQVPAGNVGVRFLLSPVNPADLNVIQGVYPSKPEIRYDLGTSSPSFIGGNEGLAQVERIGDGVGNISVGDWVIMAKPQSGTWASHAYASAKDVTPVDKRVGEVRAATMTVNPPTARGMLSDFRNLSEGDYVIQNGANSAVGQAVIQIAAARKLCTINVVRDRPNIEELKQQLTALGATHVITDQELADKATRSRVKEWTQGKDIKLGLNCVGGKITSILAGYLGHNAALVSYGAMSMSPLSLPTSLFIFKNLVSYGYWQTRWYETHSPEERQSMLREITELMLSDKLKAPEHEILSIRECVSDEEATKSLRDTLGKVAAGRFGKKLLLKFE